MHASSQHTKAELVIARAKELIVDADISIKKSQAEYDAMQTRVASHEKTSRETHKKLDGTIRDELNKLTGVADEYFASFDDSNEAV